jgi:DNA-binding transcriptional regulator YiaG
MERNNAQDARPPLPQRVSAAKLPPPEERARIRKDSGCSLRDFSRELGVSPMTVGRWESGVVHPRLDQAAAYARLLTAVAQAANPPATEEPAT